MNINNNEETLNRLIETAEQEYDISEDIVRSAWENWVHGVVSTLEESLWEQTKRCTMNEVTALVASVTAPTDDDQQGTRAARAFDPENRFTLNFDGELVLHDLKEARAVGQAIDTIIKSHQRPSLADKEASGMVSLYRGYSKTDELYHDAHVTTVTRGRQDLDARMGRLIPLVLEAWAVQGVELDADAVSVDVRKLTGCDWDVDYNRLVANLVTLTKQDKKTVRRTLRPVIAEALVLEKFGR